MKLPRRKNGAINTAAILKDKVLVLEIKKRSNIESDNINQHIYHVIHDSVKAICFCGAQLKFKGVAKGYSKSCGSLDCKKKATEKTMIERYGVKNSYQLEKTKNKIKKTNLERYGTDHPLKSKTIKNKIKRTNLERYGVEYPTQNTHIISIRSENNIKKYGCDPSKLEKVKEKTKKTNLERYGAEYPSMLESNRRRSIKTRQHLEDNKRPGRVKLNDPLFLKELVHNRQVNLNLLASIYDVDPNWLGRKIKEYGFNPLHSNFSKCHYEVAEFVKSIGFSPLCEDRKTIFPYEIDVLVNNLAIEVDGIYWHSYDKLETKEEKLKHYNKMKLCRNLGLDFISFTDYEWENKKDVLKSIIRSRLNLSNKIFARKTKFALIDKLAANEFLESNHIKGKCPLNSAYGLYYDNDLVGVICISKCRFSKLYDWEIARLAFKLNTNIVGGFSKLLKGALTYHTGSLISYTSNNKFSGKSYKKCGFEKVHENLPGYYYWKSGKVLNRMNAQKHKLPKLLDNCDENKTESENMFSAGYRRYWDCGTTLWKYSL